MEKKLLFAFAAASLIAAGCQSALVIVGEGADAAVEAIENGNFAAVTGVEWRLAAVFIDGASLGFNRDDLAAQGFADAFTLAFEGDRLSGAGAPNRFTAAFYLGENRAISVSRAAATLMAPLFEPEVLREHDFFFFLENAREWDAADGNLELLSSGRSGEIVRLLFQR